jgi:hypothetical protein
MTTFDRTKIKNININYNNGTWNPATHDMVLTYDPTSISGFKINLINKFDQPITDTNQAEELLKKFRLKD